MIEHEIILSSYSIVYLLYFFRSISFTKDEYLSNIVFVGVFLLFHLIWFFFGVFRYLRSNGQVWGKKYDFEGIEINEWWGIYRNWGVGCTFVTLTGCV